MRRTYTDARRGWVYDVASCNSQGLVTCDNKLHRYFTYSGPIMMILMIRRQKFSDKARDLLSWVLSPSHLMMDGPIYQPLVTARSPSLYKLTAINRTKKQIVFAAFTSENKRKSRQSGVRTPSPPDWEKRLAVLFLSQMGNSLREMTGMGSHPKERVNLIVHIALSAHLTAWRISMLRVAV